MYSLIRRIFFIFDAEQAHYMAMNLLKTACKSATVKKLIKKHFCPAYENHTEMAGLSFKNTVGLGAGFDKNAFYLKELEILGFGFVEIGTVTPLPQEGNEKPRLFRLPKDRALINRMGFNNDGAAAVAKRLKVWRTGKEGQEKKTHLIIGGNIGKNKNTPNELAWQDYEKCFTALHPYVDYFTINVSSPNTPGLRALQEKDALNKILSNLQELNSLCEIKRPLFLKISPDLSIPETDDVIDLLLEIKLDGIVVSNTTIKRDNLITKAPDPEKTAGGLSGLPVQKTSTELIKYIYTKTQRKILIIGSGGIFTGKDAAEKINAGASLIQVWTGFIYEGPGIVKKITHYLAGGNKI